MPRYEVRPAHTRGRLRTHWLDARLSFSFGDYVDPDRMHFGALRVLNEDRIQPGTGFEMHPHRDVEIVLLPLEGAVAHVDSLGHRAVLHPGDALLMSAGAGIRHSQHNASLQSIDRHLQIWLLPRQRGTAPASAHRHFDPRARLGRWQLIASDGARDGSLGLDQDAKLWRARLADASPLGMVADASRSRYLHVIDGAVELRQREGDAVEQLGSGDAVAWPVAQAFELRLRDARAAELLLLDLPALRADPHPSSSTQEI